MGGASEIKNLIEKVAERERFLKTVIPFVVSLVQEKGKVLKESIGSCNINIIRELANVAGFTFKTDLGQTMFGGNNIKVSYQEKRHGVLMQNRVVLDVYWQCDIDECKVNFFDESASWQSALLKLTKNKDKIVARIDKEKERRDQGRACEAQERERLAALQIRAKDLGIRT